MRCPGCKQPFNRTIHNGPDQIRKAFACYSCCKITNQGVDCIDDYYATPENTLHSDRTLSKHGFYRDWDN